MSLIKPTTTTIARAINDQNTNNSNGLKSWKIALAIGIPAAVIVAYLFYKRNSNRNTTNLNSKINKIPSKQDLNSNKNESKVDEKQQTPKSPLEDVIEIKNMGNKHFQQKKYKEAFDCYAKAIDLCPKNDKEELPKLYQNRAAAAENLKLYENCIEDCTRALELDPKYSKALLRRAKMAEHIGNIEMAFEDVTALCILEKLENKSSLLYADKLVKKLAEHKSVEKLKSRKSVAISKQFVNNFYIGLNNDPVYKNEKFLNEINSEDNTNSEMKKAIEFFNNGDFINCIDSCTNEIQNDGKYIIEALNLRGSLYMLKCQYQEAFDDFNRILRDERASDRVKSNTLIKFTALNLQKGEDNEAFRNYEVAIQIDPDNEDIYCNRAQVLAMKGRFDECFIDFNKSIELNPNHKIAILQRAFFQFRRFFTQNLMKSNKSEFNGSIVSDLAEETYKLQKLVDTYSDIPEAASLYAQVLSEQDDYAKAEDYYKIALEKDPSNAALTVQRALNFMQLKNDAEDAINMLNEAIKIDDTCEFAYEALATVEIQRGNLRSAIELFSKAVDLARNEESMINVYSLLIGAETQYKMLRNHNSSDALSFLNLIQ